MKSVSQEKMMEFLLRARAKKERDAVASPGADLHSGEEF
jgi:hypothetical protein